MIRAENLKKSFKHPKKLTLFEDLSIEVSPGESLAITGPSGIGKSTLLHILGTLEVPTEGQLFIDDEPVTKFNRDRMRRDEVGFVFQLFNLFDEITVLENILMPSRIARRENISRAKELISQVDLDDRMHHPVQLLSGGEKQRVAIARALQNSPSVILADEPTGNLDADHAREIQDLLLKQTENCSLITVTHDLEFAKRFDRSIQLSR